MFAFKGKAVATATVVAVAGLMCLGFAPAAFAADATPSTNQTTATSQTTNTSSASAQQTQGSAPAPKPAADPAPKPADPAPVVPAPKPEPAPAPVPAPAPAPAPPVAAPATTSHSSESSQSSASAPAPQVKSQSVPSASTTSNDVTPQNKPGKLQPVWCHLTGNDWKAQLGAAPSGGRHVAFPLMGDFGWGTTDSGQTLAHDRSSKLDAACGDQAPQPVKDASLTVTLTPATCTTGEQATPGAAVNATWAEGLTTVTGPGSFSFPGTANDGHLFADGTSSETKTGNLSGPIPSQSTDPYAPCYTPPVTPPTQVTIQVTTQTAMCTEGDSIGNQLGLNDTGTKPVTVDLTQGAKVVPYPLNAGQSVTIDDNWLQHEGFTYGTAITLSAEQSATTTVTFDGGTSWTPVNPATLSCGTVSPVDVSMGSSVFQCSASESANVWWFSNPSAMDVTLTFTEGSIQRQADLPAYGGFYELNQFTLQSLGLPYGTIAVSAVGATPGVHVTFNGEATASWTPVNPASCTHSTWTPPTVTLVGKCFSSTTHTGDIQVNLAESDKNVNGTSYSMALDGTIIGVFQASAGETTSFWLSEFHVTVSKGEHTLTFTNIDANNDAEKVSKTIDIEACAVVTPPPVVTPPVVTPPVVTPPVHQAPAPAPVVATAVGSSASTDLVKAEPTLWEVAGLPTALAMLVVLGIGGAALYLRRRKLAKASANQQ